MFKVLLLVVCLYLADSQIIYPQNYDNVPNPYQFSYTAPSIGGASSHQETSDGAGRVTGSYSILDEDGRSRLVEYVADEYGFRASITTNEPGTSNQNPADVTIASSAYDGYGGEPIVFQRGPGAPVAPLSPIRTPVPVQPAIVPAQPQVVPIRPAVVPIRRRVIPIRPAVLPV